MKEYGILYDTGEARKLVAQINRMASHVRFFPVPLPLGFFIKLYPNQPIQMT